VGAAVAMALFGRNSGVQAADAPAAGPDSNDAVEEIVVHGFRASLQASMETKRDATVVEDVLTSEDVGKFPDKNVAEALQRLPGVVTTRDFGEGERINVRGTLDTLTKATLNGHSLSTADWFILDQQNATRSFNYLMLPADLIGKTEVIKTARADIEEGGIGGTVNIETRRPLDLESFTAFASLEAAHTELSGKTNPYMTGLVSWKDKDDTIGFLLAGIYQERQIRRDGFETLGYVPIATGSSTLMPLAINSALFQQDRIRKGGNFDMEVKPTDQLDINFTGLLSIFDAENTNQSMYGDLQRAVGNGGTLTNCVLVNGSCVAGTISSANGGTGDVAYFYDSFHRIAKSTSSNLDLNVKWTPNDQWTVKGIIGYTQATGNTEPQYFTEYDAPGVFDYDMRKGFSLTPRANTAGTTVSFTNPNSWAFDFANDDIFTNDDRETYGYLDAEMKLDLGALKSIKFGGKFTNHERDAEGNFTTYGGFSAPILAQGIPMSTWANGTTPSNFLSNIAGPGSQTSSWVVNYPFAQKVLSAQELVSGRVPYPIQGFTINEKTYGGYVMGNFGGDRWRGNAGVRFAHTVENTTGALTTGDTTLPGVVNNPFGAFIPSQSSVNYNDVLPSMNLAYNVTDSFIARFAVAKVMSRPDFIDMVPVVSLNPGSLSGTAGNPNINAYRAWQEDLSFEYYPDKNTAYTLALYNKDLKSFIVDQPVQEFLNFTGQQAPSAVCTTISANLFNCPFTIDNKANSDGGTLRGVEVGITQPIWGGFGAQANYTRSNATLRSHNPFPGNSKNTYNLTAFFENELFSARVSWTQRSAFFLSFDRNSELSEGALTSLDAAASWNVTKWMAVTFEAQNLTDAKVVQYDTVLSNPRAIYDNGRVYFAGVKFRF